MKLIKSLCLFLFLTVCVTSHAEQVDYLLEDEFDYEEYESSPCDTQIVDLTKKFYITEDQIKLSGNKIYIDVEGIIYETPAVFTDENGYYIEQVAKSGKCAWYEWECERCGYCNLRGVDYECRVPTCQYPISPKKNKK